MPEFIDITNREKLIEKFEKLKPDTIPLWGRMSAQQMVEHLADQARYSNGVKACELEVSLQDAVKGKQRGIYTNAEIPKGALSHLPLNEIEYPDLSTAIKILNREMDAFHEYFKPVGRTAVHGGFGAMNYNEWVIWHGKHFTHHFKQFGLMPDV